MNEVAVSSPTDSGCTGVSRPVSKKGIICPEGFLSVLREQPLAIEKFLEELCGGLEVEILDDPYECEAYGFRKVRVVFRNRVIVDYIPSYLVQEVSNDG